MSAQPAEPLAWMIAACRALRIHIHSLDGTAWALSPDHPENKKWLDRVSVEDAKLFATEFAKHQPSAPAEPLAWMREIGDAFSKWCQTYRDGFLNSNGKHLCGTAHAAFIAGAEFAQHTPVSPVPERARDIAESCAKIAETTAFGDRAARAIREHFKGLPVPPAEKGAQDINQPVVSPVPESAEAQCPQCGSEYKPALLKQCWHSPHVWHGEEMCTSCGGVEGVQHDLDCPEAQE